MTPRIFYVTPTLAVPRGGVKQAYRHVEILRRHGHEAFIYHRDPGFRPGWFPSTAPVVGPAELEAGFRRGHDIVVLTESLGGEATRFPPRRVLFDQNVYYGFMALDDDLRDSPFLAGDPVITVSEHNAELLRHGFPALDVAVVRCGVDEQVFTARPLRAKRRQIVCPATKGAPTNMALFHLLMSRARAGLNRLGDVRWIFLRDRTEAEVARILEESLACVFASVEEGFGLLAAEAMLAGCVLLTHPVGPQREFVPADYLYAEHDLLAMAGALEALAAATPDELERRQAVADRARERIRRDYSLAREEASVLAAWGHILALG